MLFWSFTIVGGIILGDLLSGIFHWWEDRYGKTDWPILGKYIIEPNINHHKHPSDMCKDGYWSHSFISMLFAIPLAILSWYYGLCILTIGFLLVTQANEVHSWAHEKQNRLIRFFQRIGLLLSPKHHAVHHKRPYTQRYCVMTNLLNPILHRIYFWNILEQLVWTTIGVMPNPEREIY